MRLNLPLDGNILTCGSCDLSGLLTVHYSREPGQVAQRGLLGSKARCPGKRFPSKERLYCCDTGSRAFKILMEKSFSLVIKQNFDVSVLSSLLPKGFGATTSR